MKMRKKIHVILRLSAKNANVAKLLIILSLVDDEIEMMMAIY